MKKDTAIYQSFMNETKTHYHKPIVRRIYYNNCVVMVTNCSECKDELNRWLIDESYNVKLNTSSCPIGVTDNIEVS